MQQFEDTRRRANKQVQFPKRLVSSKRPTLWRRSISLVTVPGLGEVSESTPPSSDAENHTMPHRDTVASVAYCRLSTCPHTNKKHHSIVMHRIGYPVTHWQAQAFQAYHAEYPKFPNLHTFGSGTKSGSGTTAKRARAQGRRQSSQTNSMALAAAREQVPRRVK